MRLFDSFINENTLTPALGTFLTVVVVSCHLRLELIFILIISLISQHVAAAAVCCCCCLSQVVALPSSSSSRPVTSLLSFISDLLCWAETLIIVSQSSSARLLFPLLHLLLLPLLLLPHEIITYVCTQYLLV